MDNFDNWAYINIDVLNHLYYKMIQISNIHGIKIIDAQSSFDNFVYMVFNESSKKIINRELYPQFFDRIYNSDGYQDYKILEISNS